MRQTGLKPTVVLCWLWTTGSNKWIFWVNKLNQIHSDPFISLVKQEKNWQIFSKSTLKRTVLPITKQECDLLARLFRYGEVYDALAPSAPEVDMLASRLKAVAATSNHRNERLLKSLQTSVSLLNVEVNKDPSPIHARAQVDANDTHCFFSIMAAVRSDADLVGEMQQPFGWPAKQALLQGGWRVFRKSLPRFIPRWCRWRIILQDLPADTVRANSTVCKGWLQDVAIVTPERSQGVISSTQFVSSQYKLVSELCY